MKSKKEDKKLAVKKPSGKKIVTKKPAPKKVASKDKAEKKVAIKKTATKKPVEAKKPTKVTAQAKSKVRSTTVKKDTGKLLSNDVSVVTKATPKKEKAAPKKFFPKGAKPPAPPAGALEPKVPSKRTPWMKKPVENPHSTPAGPCVNLKDLFDNHINKKYKRMKDEQRYALWKSILPLMLTEPFNKIGEIIDSHLSKK